MNCMFSRQKQFLPQLLLISQSDWLIWQYLTSERSERRSERVRYCSCHSNINRRYYTVARRYEFYFRVAKQYWFCQEKIKFISSSRRVMFFLLYRHADDCVSDDFPKISDHLPKISKDFPNLFRITHERFRTFSENFRRCPKMSEDCRRLPRNTRRCFDDIPTNLSTR